jgi:hypothetical protein
LRINCLFFYTGRETFGFAIPGIQEEVERFPLQIA